jgi:hypothetical protein
MIATIANKLNIVVATNTTNNFNFTMKAITQHMMLFTERVESGYA